MTPIRDGVLIDASFLVAFMDQRSEHHRSCVSTFRRIRRALVPWVVTAEAANLVRHLPRGRRRLLEVLGESRVELVHLEQVDLPGIDRYLAKYADLKLDLADACLMHLADRLALRFVATLDATDFAALRREDGAAMSVVPQTSDDS